MNMLSKRCLSVEVRVTGIYRELRIWGDYCHWIGGVRNRIGRKKMLWNR